MRAARTRRQPAPKFPEGARQLRDITVLLGAASVSTQDRMVPIGPTVEPGNPLGPVSILARKRWGAAYPRSVCVQPRTDPGTASPEVPRGGSWGSYGGEGLSRHGLEHT